MKYFEFNHLQITEISTNVIGKFSNFICDVLDVKKIEFEKTVSSY